MNNRMSKIVICFLLIKFSWSADLTDALRSFEDNPGYSQPIATHLGTAINSGWVQTTKLSKEFNWGFGLDVNLAFTSQDDLEYNWNRQTNCSDILDRKATAESAGATVLGTCLDKQTYVVPTLFGGATNRQITQYYLESNNDSTFTISEDANININDGFDGFLGLLPIALLSTRFEYEHSQITLKAFPLDIFPLSFDGYSLGIGIYGLGVQHSLNHYFKKELPLDLALASSWSNWAVNFETKDWDGSLELSGFAHQYSVVLGKRFGNFEINTEVGYELSNFEAGGGLSKVNTEGELDKISPKIAVVGRNGFKVSFNLLGDFGSYRLFGAQSVGAQRGNTINFMNFQTNGASK